MQPKTKLGKSIPKCMITYYSVLILSSKHGDHVSGDFIFRGSFAMGDCFDGLFPEYSSQLKIY